MKYKDWSFMRPRYFQVKEMLWFKWHNDNTIWYIIMINCPIVWLLKNESKMSSPFNPKTIYILKMAINFEGGIHLWTPILAPTMLNGYINLMLNEFYTVPCHHNSYTVKSNLWFDLSAQLNWIIFLLRITQVRWQIMWLSNL